MKKSFLICSLFFLCIRFGLAQPYYVDASNTHPKPDGLSWERAWPNFSEVSNTSISGTVNVAPGLYVGSENRIDLNGRSNLTIQRTNPPDPQESYPEVILNGNENFDYGIKIYNSSDITIKGLTVINFKKNGILIDDSGDTGDNIIITGCNVHNTIGESTSNSFAAIFLENSKHCTIEECIITQIKTGPFVEAQTEGIYAQGCTDLVIRKNYIELFHETVGDIHIDGIQLVAYLGVYCADVIIERNVIVNRGSQPMGNGRSGIGITGTGGYINIINNNIAVPHGKDLINLHYDSQTLDVKILNNTLVSMGNPNHVMEIVKGTGGDPEKLNIKNNILFKKGAAVNNKLAAIYFAGIRDDEISLSNLNHNLYHNNTATQQQKVELVFSNGTVDWDYNSPIGTDLDPKFVSTAAQNHRYYILYDSPAKNLGAALPEVINDITLSHRRPYWGADYDIGAYEVEDTHLKLGAFGVGSLDEVDHTVTAFGYFWERNPDGSFTMSENYALQSATESSTGNFDENNLFEFTGVEYNWLDRSNNSSGKRIAAGFYRVTNTLDPAKFMYVDLREKVSNYSLNVYLKYNNYFNRFEHYNPDTKLFTNVDQTIPIVRIWQIHNQNYSYSEEIDWRDGVVVVKSPDNRPLVCWLPFGTSGNYTVLRSDNCENPDYEPIMETSNLYYEDTQLEFCTAVPPALCDKECVFNYKISKSSDTTHSYSVSLIWGDPQKRLSDNFEIHSNGFLLDQNYPNPFNPVTTIRYTLPEEGITSLVIYDILGREITTLLNEKRAAGNYSINFDGSNLASGIYICKLTSGRYTAVKKLQLIR